MRTMLMRMLGGAVVGAAGMGLFLALVGDPFKDMDDPETLLAGVTGVVYAITGLMVWLGLAVPRLGSSYLNVEDADEIREEGSKLRPSALVMILIGAFLLILALSESIGRELSLIAAFACLAGIGIGTWVAAKRYDELMRRLGFEASSLTLQLAMLVVGAWAVLAQLGYVAWLGPLSMVSGLALLQLLASFVVVGRHGMLMPR